MRSIIVAFFLAAGLGAQAQVFSPEEFAILREQFIESVADSVDGSFVQIGTLPPNRLESAVPAALLTEADPVALASLATVVADLAAVSATADTAASDADSLDSRVAALEARVAAWNQAVVDASSWTNSLWSTNVTMFTGNIVMKGVGTTNTLHLVSGSIVSNTYEGP